MRIALLLFLLVGPIKKKLPPKVAPPPPVAAVTPKPPLKLEMTTQQGHTTGGRVALSPDSRYFAHLADGNLKLWTADGKLLRTIAVEKSANAVSFMADGSKLRAGNRTFDLLGNEDKPTPDDAFGGPHARSPDGKRFVYSDGSMVKLVIDGKPAFMLFNHITTHGYFRFIDNERLISFDIKGRGGIFDHEKMLTKLDVGPGDGSHIDALTIGDAAFASADLNKAGVVKLYTYDGTKTATMDSGALQDDQPYCHQKNMWCPRARISALAFSPDGAVLASADSAVRLWSGGKQIGILGDGRMPPPKAIAWSKDGGSLLVSYDDGALVHYSKDGTVLRRIPGGGTTNAWSVAYSGDSKQFALGFSSGMVRLFAPDGRLVRSIPATPHAYDKKLAAPMITSLAFSPDNQLLACGGDMQLVQMPNKFGARIELRSLDGTLLRTLWHHGQGWVQSLAFSPDGTQLVSTLLSGTVAVFNVKTGEKVRELPEKPKNPTGYSSYQAALFLPGGKRVLSVNEHQGVWLTPIDGSAPVEVTGFSRPWAAAVGKDVFAVLDYPAGARLYDLDGRFLRAVSANGATSIRFAPDGNTFAVGMVDSAGPLLQVFNLDGTPVQQMRGFPITRLAYSGDGRQVVTISDYQRITIWNTATAASARLLIDNDNWVFFTPDGYWDASKNGGSLVAMVKGDTAWGIDQFALKYNRPDLILKAIGSADAPLVDHYYNQYLRRLRRAGMSEGQVASELTVPAAEITGAKLQDQHMVLSVSLDGKGRALKSYNVYVNDVPLFGAYGKPLTQTKAMLDERIELTAGTNKIEVSCTDDKGAESFRALTSAQVAPRPDKGDLYFIGFGVSKYKDPSLTLKYAAKDVTDLAAMFKAQKGFAQVITHAFVDEQVTRAKIVEAKALLAGARPQDTVVVFIAGHGLHDSDKEATYYYLTQDADLEALASTAAKFEDIEGLLQGVAPRNKLFLMDTCESGERDGATQQYVLASASKRGILMRGIKKVEAIKAAATVPMRPYLFDRGRFIYNDLLRRSCAVVFSSSQGGEFSYEREDIQNGVFTEEIMKAIGDRSADADRNGAVSVDELRSFVAHAVAKATDGMQNPTVDRDNLFQKFSF